MNDITKELGVVRGRVCEVINGNEQAHTVAEVNAEMIECDTDTQILQMADYALLKVMWSKLSFTEKLDVLFEANELAIKEAIDEWNEVHTVE